MTDPQTKTGVIAIVDDDEPLREALGSVLKAAGFPTLGVSTSYDIEKLADADWRVQTLRPGEVLGKIPKLKLKA